MNTEQELRRCPFCGGEAVLDEFENDHIIGWFGRCLECNASMPYAISKPIAVKQWNRRSSDEQAEVVGHTANCCNCGRIIDTREEAEGGDKFGAEASDGRWLCSMECWDAVFRDEGPYASPPAVAAGGVTEALREAIDWINECYRFGVEALGPYHTRPDRDADGTLSRMGALSAALAVGDEGIREGQNGERAASVMQLPPASRPIRDEYRAMSPELRDAIRTGKAPDPWRPLPTPPSRGEGV